MQATEAKFSSRMEMRIVPSSSHGQDPMRISLEGIASRLLKA
jgi:hypothetical protein